MGLSSRTAARQTVYRKHKIRGVDVALNFSKTSCGNMINLTLMLSSGITQGKAVQQAPHAYGVSLMIKLLGAPQSLYTA
jgi:hypothetical protein